MDSNIIDDFTCKLGTKQKRSTHRHRIVEFTDYEGKIIRVITNLYTVTAEMIAGIYKARWGVELFFRWIKQNPNIPRLFGTTKNAVYNQLFSALLTYVLLQHTHTWVNKNIREKPLSLLSFTRKNFEGKLPVEWQVAIQHFCDRFLRVYSLNMDING
ncbi:transposase [Propionispira raffinosivorans]|uniref:transposase n=1 Tax=Propionispira raffinosivorans TaxID=86959 RepID=UPI0009FEB807|nr:transposase [Propionispira raffinosivorans]